MGFDWSSQTTLNRGPYDLTTVVRNKIYILNSLEQHAIKILCEYNLNSYLKNLGHSTNRARIQVVVFRLATGISHIHTLYIHIRSWEMAGMSRQVHLCSSPSAVMTSTLFNHGWGTGIVQLCPHLDHSNISQKRTK